MGLRGGSWGEGERGEPDLPVSSEGWENVGEVRHVFTHFNLELDVWRLKVERGDALEGFQTTPIEEAMNALPSVFAKALKLAIR